MLREKTRLKHNILTLLKKDVYSLFFPTIIALFLLSGYWHLSSYFINIIWGINVILWMILFIIIWVWAGFVIMDSLVVVAAELSLLIYLAQSYCDVSNRSTDSDNALKSLLYVGIIYIIVRFFGTLFKKIKEDNGGKLLEDKIITTIFIFITGLLLWQMYLIMNPITNNLCVFR